MTINQLRERLKFEASYEEQKRKNGDHPKYITNEDYIDGFIDGLERALELTNDKN